MNDAIKIEELTLVNRLETANVMRLAFNFVKQDWSEAESINYIDRMLKTHQTYIAKIDNKVVGFIAVELKDDHIFVDAIATLPEHMNQGIAKALWNRLVEYSRATHTTTINMLADPKSLAYQWYMRLGLKQTGWVELTVEV